MAMLIEFEGKTPQVHESVFLAENAVLIGDVVVEEEASIWYGVVLRGDQSFIRVGPAVNVQDNTVIHADTEIGTILEERVSIGHGAVLHDTRICAGSMVGMNATLLHGSVIGAGSLVGAGSVVREGFEAPDGSVVAGVPAKVLKQIEGNAADWLIKGTDGYLDLKQRYAATARLVEG